jgi:hypothetical protein
VKKQVERSKCFGDDSTDEERIPLSPGDAFCVRYAMQRLVGWHYPEGPFTGSEYVNAGPPCCLVIAVLEKHDHGDTFYHVVFWSPQHKRLLCTPNVDVRRRCWVNP